MLPYRLELAPGHTLPCTPAPQMGLPLGPLNPLEAIPHMRIHISRLRHMPCPSIASVVMYLDIYMHQALQQAHG